MASGELRYAVNFAVLGKYLGQLCLIQTALFCVPLAVAVMTTQWHFAWTSAMVTAVLAVSGAALNRITINREVQFNEAMIIVSAAFIMSSLSMSFPMMTTGLKFSDAWFEAVSGVTTTGLTVIEDISGKPFVLLFSRAWMQWYGGLGIVVFSLALFMRPGMNAQRISTAQLGEIATGTQTHASRMCWIYLVMTAMGLVLLLLTGIGLKEATIHALTGVSTGGFSTSQSSLAGLNNPAAVRIALLLGFFGAVSLTLYYRTFLKRNAGTFVLDPEVQALIIMTVLASLAIILLLHFREEFSWYNALCHGSALALSAQTTTGYSTMEVSRLPEAAKMILIICMFTGGSLGSTAGGIKLLRFLFIGKAMKRALMKTAMPSHAVSVFRLKSDRVDPEEIQDAVLILVFFLVMNVFSWLVFLAAGCEPMNSLFDVISATGTVGLSTGVTSAKLAIGLKMLLCVNMLMGRLEVLALLILFYPPTWLGKRRERL